MPVTRVDEKNGVQKEEPIVRVVKMLSGDVEVRRVPPSKEALKELGLRSKIEIVSHLSINPPHIERKIALKKAEIIRSMAAMDRETQIKFIAEGPIDFVSDKENRKLFDIICTRCGDKVAYVWARTEKLEDWVDLHYVCWFDKFSWRGAMTINVSPIDARIGFECACGEDTRDFRKSRSLPPVQRELMIEYSMKHRDFGNKDSKFIAVAKK